MGKTSNGALPDVQEKREDAPPERVVTFIRQMIRGEKFHSGSERRLSLRYPVTMPVRATPLDDRQNPDGEAFLAVTRDISVGGLCMYHLEPVRARYLQLELASSSGTGEHLHVVLEVVRCHPTGPLYEIAGRFVSCT
jgi:hypothetical protein